MERIIRDAKKPALLLISSCWSLMLSNERENENAEAMLSIRSKSQMSQHRRTWHTRSTSSLHWQKPKDFVFSTLKVASARHQRTFFPFSSSALLLLLLPTFCCINTHQMFIQSKRTIPSTFFCFVNNCKWQAKMTTLCCCSISFFVFSPTDEMYWA